ncbi:urea carboxylase [Amantichitinum ursilacus]|uniref:Acetyl-/propionyl-coenzyme A carboxylase alpha chain n=1 Tax=Amantichitinum ursilacus TaxID=857265 RepID=A0A0N0GLX4_9NEIS|nr:urea carboxylase [Amantichitinum ursilacus]KPC50526.1 Acetyl-/propionyl-coenzyme A carboxylase alpha chain [Amantichitinum ursilacus]
MFSKVLIANRGEIACRIIKTLQRMGIAAVAVYSEADRHAAHVALADEAVCVGPAAAALSYLRSETILQAALDTGAQAIHPGYGFLSENADFAAACADAGIVFIGPRPEHMRAFGLKHTARELAQLNNVPLLPGSGLLADVADARIQAERIGYPVMLKSTAGGGGIGMQLCRDADGLTQAWAGVQRLSQNNFKNGGIYLEKFVEDARHIEVQIFGASDGQIVHLGERDCSTQRRNQKVIEETPAPHLSATQRQQLCDTAVRLVRAVGYQSAGTVEFVFDVRSQQFYFLEVNTRLQVEHGVTELVNEVDLVEWMLLAAAGEGPDLNAWQWQPQGAAMQVRVYAEDPNKQFQPAAGLLTHVQLPVEARVDSWVSSGTEVPAFYDPLVAKILTHGVDRDEALRRMQQALTQTDLAGIETNLDYLRQILADDVFASGRQITRSLAGFNYRPATVDVLEAGVQSSIQDWPGRVGYWGVGVPPSGPMDSQALRLANRLVGNAEGAAALELTVTGPSLRFNRVSVIALTGAAMAATLDDVPMPLWRAVPVAAGSVLRVGAIEGGGCRSYLAVSGGFAVPDYLGSKATFTLGQFGGHGGRTLRVGDVLHLGDDSACVVNELASAAIPAYPTHWDIGVLYGPHGAPDFFTDADIDAFFNAEWQVHYNSSRTGVRLIGPKPEWARRDGGEAGLHPSNIHDNAYAIGAIDFTGDMPVILGPDGPSLGGFVCPAVVVDAELWKLGQLRPGNTVRFKCVDRTQAAAMQSALDQRVASLQGDARLPLPSAERASPIVHRIAAQADQPEIVCRQAGDRYLLVEYGPLVLDLELRLRVQALYQWFVDTALAGVIDLTPGIRSLQIHFDPRVLPLPRLLAAIERAQAGLVDIASMEIPSRTVWLPLSWDDAATRLAIDKYMQSVRPDAPWCPSNIEFIRRINGLPDLDAVQRILFEASYLVMGLGDVYLGAPVATPLDPRHRLVTTKYNPARTWTPENAVGIGGAYLCVYGMEGPGGYQFVGRTVQMWNRHKTTADFTAGKPWLLRFFDQIRFYPVSADELLQMREDFIEGRFKLRIEEGVFRLGDYQAFLAEHAASIAAFQRTQQAAFAAERAHWEATGANVYNSEPAVADNAAEEVELPAGHSAVATQVAGNVWKINVEAGAAVTAGQVVAIVESMKMEINIVAPRAGTVQQVLCQAGTGVVAGQRLLVIS